MALDADLTALRRPLLFLRDADTLFRVCEAIELLLQPDDFNTFEQIGILCDALELLPTAVSATDVAPRYSAQLRIAIKNFMAERADVLAVHDQLIRNSQPPTGSGNAALCAWCSAHLDYINMTSKLAVKFKYENAWTRLRAFVQQRHHEMMRVDSMPEESIEHTLPRVASGSLYPFPSDTLRSQFGAMRNKFKGSGTESVLQAVTRHLRSWSTTAQVQVSREFFDFLTEIGQVLELVNCADSHGPKATKTVRVQQMTRILYHGWVAQLVSRYASSVSVALRSRYLALDRTITHGVLRHSMAAKFARLANDIQHATSRPVQQTLSRNASWLDGPQVLSTGEAYELSRDLQELFRRYQDMTDRTESSRLRRNLWRRLFAVYNLIQNGMRIPSDFELERGFFHDLTIRGHFEMITQMSEMAIPKVTDHIVSRYRDMLMAAYDNGAISDMGPNDSRDQTRMASARTQENQFKSTAILDSLGQIRCDALRLHHIDERNPPRGPISVDINLGTDSQGDGSTKHCIMAQNRQSTVSQRVEADKEHYESPARVPGVNLAENNDATINIKEREKHFERTFGINLPLKTDFVTLPFAETRALEVAQQRQISRDLAQQMGCSTGPQTRDVLNIPPRHTLPPGHVSAWLRYMPYGPVDIVINLIRRLTRRRTSILKTAKQRMPLLPRHHRENMSAWPFKPNRPQRWGQNRIRKSVRPPRSALRL